MEDSSGEDGTSYQLAVVAANAPPQASSYRVGKHRRITYSEAGDPAEPRRFFKD